MIKKSSLFLKIIILVVAIILVSSLITLTVTNTIISRRLYENTADVLYDVMNPLKDYLENIFKLSDYTAYTTAINNRMEHTFDSYRYFSYIKVYSAAGFPEFSYPLNTADLKIKEYGPDELKRVRTSYVNYGSRFIEIITPLKDNERPIGYLRCGIDINEIDSQIMTFLITQIAVAAGILLLNIILVFFITNKLTSPLRKIIEEIYKVKETAAFKKIEVKTRDEVGLLADAFNTMGLRLQERIDDLRSVQMWSAEITSELRKEELYNLVSNTFQKSAAVEKVSLLLLDEKRKKFRLVAGKNTNKNNFEIPYSEGIAGKVYETLNYQLVNDIQKYPDYIQFYGDPSAIKEETQFLSVPLVFKEKLKGMVNLAGKKEGEFQKSKIMLYQTLANQVASALENAHLYELAITDGLTKVYLNRYFHQRLEEEIEYSLKSSPPSPLSLILFDIDNFKSFNDTYGHQTGDIVLIELAKIMKKTVRTIDFKEADRRSDVVARYGGEEFIIILPDTDVQSAYKVSERLRKNIEKFDEIIGPNGELLKVTVSLGVAEFKEGITKESLIKYSDIALYKAKQTGKNKTVIYEEGMNMSGSSDEH